MQDTTPEFRLLVEEAYACMTPEERVRICTEMFDTAFALVEASMPEGLDTAEQRFRVCERFYGDLAARALRGARPASAAPGHPVPTRCIVSGAGR